MRVKKNNTVALSPQFLHILFSLRPVQVRNSLPGKIPLSILQPHSVADTVVYRLLKQGAQVFLSSEHNVPGSS